MPFNKKRHFNSDSDGETSQQVVKKSRSTKPAAPEGSKGIDESGNSYWDIGKNRRVSYSMFKGHGLVNIREYYSTPDGELRPGKKGISLSMAQFNVLLKVIPELSQELRAQGHDVGAAPPGPSAVTANDASANDASVKTEKPKKAPKANIDATSDEEEDGVDE
ncbi:transcriptional Coactivator p15-domain-containing protein [Staphylotrichum tortipilum]|uniref:Transcriptional Coactivator p15-domain-containing protein n=1 Tax=Staphylotrichum tortipilum TaxID=2831512 RepID=A0AAN6RU09_9PEZI|nr:transcriptional Coactivator p15-domain-containing protein [Staphylotrichum longicolle]